MDPTETHLALHCSRQDLEANGARWRQYRMMNLILNDATSEEMEAAQKTGVQVDGKHYSCLLYVPAARGPAFFHFDSLKPAHETSAQAMSSRMNLVLTCESSAVVSVDCQHQRHGSGDCGLHTLYNVRASLEHFLTTGRPLTHRPAEFQPDGMRTNLRNMYPIEAEPEKQQRRPTRTAAIKSGFAKASRSSEGFLDGTTPVESPRSLRKRGSKKIQKAAADQEGQRSGVTRGCREGRLSLPTKILDLKIGQNSIIFTILGAHFRVLSPPRGRIFRVCPPLSPTLGTPLEQRSKRHAEDLTDTSVAPAETRSLVSPSKSPDGKHKKGGVKGRKKKTAAKRANNQMAQENGHPANDERVPRENGGSQNAPIAGADTVNDGPRELVNAEPTSSSAGKRARDPVGTRSESKANHKVGQGQQWGKPVTTLM